MNLETKHTPVLLKEVINILNPKPGEFFIDGTIGSGGHAVKIFEKILPTGKLLGLDLDKKNLGIAESKILTGIKYQVPRLHQACLPARQGFDGQASVKKNLILINGNYADLSEILQRYDFPKADGLLLDLGMSSEQLEHSGRGFSFTRDEPLDMRYTNEIQNLCLFGKQAKSKIQNIMMAAEIVNSFSEKELADIFFKYGEERFSRRIARKIVEERKKKRILTTFDIVEVIKKAVPKNYEKGRIHPATRVFQALRIYTNDELGNLERLLKDLPEIIRVGARIAIISFHSLEDRIVKNYFREKSKEKKMEILTKKPIIPSIEEIEQNPRSRSAKLRAAIIQPTTNN